MRRPTKTILMHYGGALFVTAIAVELRAFLDPWLGDRDPFMMQFAAVVCAAWFGGLGPAIFSLIVGALGAAYFFLPPRHSFAIVRFEDLISVALYGVAGCAALAMIGSLRKSRSIVREATEGSEAARETKNIERRWRSFAEALPILAWTDLPNGQCDWLSSQWEKYTGIAENELLGLQWVDKVLHPDDRERTLACWMAACADEGDYDIEYRIRRHDGEYRWFKTRGIPMRDEQGKIVYWFGTCTDIEDNKRLEEAFRRQQAVLTMAETVATSSGTFKTTKAGGLPKWKLSTACRQADSREARGGGST
jgi:PAS domain S-box-containing protein